MGNLSDLGVRGCYWTSTPAPWSAFYENSVYYLFFKQGEIGMRGVMEYFSGNAALGKNYWKVQ